MPKPKPRKTLRPRGGTRVKGFASRGLGKKWILVLLVVLLLIPTMQVAVVRFIIPPLTLPMLIDQGSAMFSSAPKRPLRYRWIDLLQIVESSHLLLFAIRDSRIATTSLHQSRFGHARHEWLFRWRFAQSRVAQLGPVPTLAAFVSRSAISTPPRFATNHSVRAMLAVFVETHRLRTSDAGRD